MRRGLLLVLANTFKYLAYPFQYIYHSLVPEKIAGFNKWDEEWESGSYNNSTGEKQSDNSKIRSKNLIPVIGGQAYYFKSSQSLTVLCYDQAKNQIKSWNSGYNQVVATNQAITLPANCVYIVFYLTGTSYSYDICINVSNANVNGKYLPYSPYKVKNAANVAEIAGSSEVVNQHVDQTLVPTGTSNGVTFTNNNDGSFTATGTASAYAYKVFPVTLIVGNKYLLFGGPANTNSNCGLTMTSPSAYDYGSGVIFTANQASVHVYMFVQNGYAISGSLRYVPQLINLTQEFPFDTPSSVSDRRVQNIIANGYRKYNTGKIVTSNVGVITGCGRNLIDKSTRILRKIKNDNGVDIDDTSSYYSQMIRVQPGETLSSNFTVQRFYYYDIGGNWLRRTAVNQGSGPFTIPSDVYFIQVQVEPGFDDTNIYLQHGDTLLPYVPYRNVLPVEYQEVEYIESTGTQYIDTDVSLTKTIDSILDIYFDPSVNNNKRFISYETSEQFAYDMYYESGYIYFRSGRPLVQVVYSTPQAARLTIENKLTTTTMTAIINNTVIGTKDISSAPAPTANSHIFLFARNGAGTAVAFGSFKLYSCKMYDNSALVRNFIPCYRKSDNTIGFYDTVQNKFYVNSGSGTFLKGKDTDYIGTLPFVYQGGGINTARNTWVRTDTEEIFTRQVWDYTFTGSENVTVLNTATDTNNVEWTRYSITVVNNLSKNHAANVMFDYSSQFTFGDTASSTVGYRLDFRTNNIYIIFKTSDFSNGSAMASALANHSIEYELNTPQEVRIPRDKLGIVDLGSLTWTYDSYNLSFYAYLPYCKQCTYGSSELPPNLFCEKYINKNTYYLRQSDNMIISTNNNQLPENARILIKDTSFGTDATAFKASVAGQYLFYETSSTVTPLSGTLGIEAGGSVTTGAFGWVRNQLVTNGDFTSTNHWGALSSNGTLSVSDNILTYTATAIGANNYSNRTQQNSSSYVVSGNKYLIYGYVKSSKAFPLQVGMNNTTVVATNNSSESIVNDWNFAYCIMTVVGTVSTYSHYSQIGMDMRTGVVGDTYQIKNVQLIDLTLAFGSGNEPTSTSDPRIQRILDMGYIPTNTTGAYEIVNTEALPNVTFRLKCK